MQVHPISKINSEGYAFKRRCVGTKGPIRAGLCDILLAYGLFLQIVCSRTTAPEDDGTTIKPDGGTTRVDIRHRMPEMAPSQLHIVYDFILQDHPKCGRADQRDRHCWDSSSGRRLKSYSNLCDSVISHFKVVLYLDFRYDIAQYRTSYVSAMKNINITWD